MLKVTFYRHGNPPRESEHNTFADVVRFCRDAYGMEVPWQSVRRCEEHGGQRNFTTVGMRINVKRDF